MSRGGRGGMAGRLAASFAPVQTEERESATLALGGEMAGIDRRAREALAAHALDEAVLTGATVRLGELARGARVMRGEMLAAGRALAWLQANLGPGGYRALSRAGLVPYGESAASRLRTIAEAVDSGRIPEAALPRTPKPAYEAARLPPAEVARLLADGTLRPEASAGEIAKAARSPTTPAVPQPAGPDRQRLKRRLAVIAATVARLEAEAEEIRARLR